jgi:tetratricopeptide (TPR) repeat protein
VALHDNHKEGEEIMKKIVVLIVLVLIAAAGCTQQKQEQKGQGAYPPGAAPMVTPGQIKLLEETAKANPKNADAWTALGNALMDSGRFSEAIGAYQKSLDIDPKNVDVRVDMGTCYKNIAKPERAIEEYRRALKINPNHPFAHRNSGVVLAFDLHDKAQGIKEFEKYLDLAPNAPDAGQIRHTIQQLKAGK